MIGRCALGSVMKRRAKKTALGGFARAALAGEKLVFHNLKVMLGLDRARIMFTGAAPVSPDLIRWYRAIGLDLYELYGQTECSGITSSNRDGANRLGSIGQAVPHVEMKIAEDGEILYRGPHIFKGYLNQPEKTSRP